MHNMKQKSFCTLAKTASIHISFTIQMTMIATTTMTTYETLKDMFTEYKTEDTHLLLLGDILQTKYSPFNMNLHVQVKANKFST